MSNWVDHLGFRLKAEIQSLSVKSVAHGDARTAKTDVNTSSIIKTHTHLGIYYKLLLSFKKIKSYTCQEFFNDGYGLFFI